ncbi:MAG: aminotransferase class V-fold PLP-dependent enzyme [Thermomicrobiales bacterium]
METYRRLGLRPVINCATTYTRLGGSIMAPHVARAMADAAGAFVDVVALQEAVGQRLAELTGNEAAYVSNGAAAGLAIATAACVAGDDPAIMARLPNDLAGLKNEVIVHRTQRNWYDVAIRQVGVKLVEIGHTLETAPWELDAAISERTAAVFYFAGSHLNRNTLPLPFVIERAHARGVPVIVDAAAQVPPVSNLWHFTAGLGADLAIFSGGKAMAGPQNSGLCAGTAEIVSKMHLNGPPFQKIARSMKVSKEAMIGLLTAVETYVNRDHDGDAARWSAVVDQWIAAWQDVEPDGVTVARVETNEAGEPIPRVILRLGPRAPWDRDGFVEVLRRDESPIEVVLNDPASVAFSPHLLQEGEAEIVATRVRKLLEGRQSAALATAGTIGAR